MKRIIKLILFNLAFVVLAILCFSKRGFSLNFDPSNGALHLALSVSITLFGLATFFYSNYLILTKQEKVVYKIDKLSTINECITAMQKCLKTDPAFKDEINIAIEQLHTLKRRGDSLHTLLELNASESFSYLNRTANIASFGVFSNIKRIISRLIVFDNQEYIQNMNNGLQDTDISEHRTYINSILEENQNLLKEYSKLLIAVSAISDRKQINIDEMKNMTAALEQVLERKTFQSFQNNYSENINIFKED